MASQQIDLAAKKQNTFPPMKRFDWDFLPGVAFLSWEMLHCYCWTDITARRGRATLLEPHPSRSDLRSNEVWSNFSLFTSNYRIHLSFISCYEIWSDNFDLRSNFVQSDRFHNRVPCMRVADKNNGENSNRVAENQFFLQLPSGYWWDSFWTWYRDFCCELVFANLADNFSYVPCNYRNGTQSLTMIRTAKRTKGLLPFKKDCSGRTSIETVITYAHSWN